MINQPLPTYDPAKRHGSPYDRGSADFYYGRGYAPHYYEGATGSTPRRTDLTPAELEAYRAGWDAAEERGDRKEWD